MHGIGSVLFLKNVGDVMNGLGLVKLGGNGRLQGSLMEEDNATF